MAPCTSRSVVAAIAALSITLSPAAAAARLPTKTVSSYSTTTRSTPSTSSKTTRTTSWTSPSRLLPRTTVAPSPPARPDLIAAGLSVNPATRTAWISVRNTGDAVAGSNIARIVVSPTNDARKSIVAGVVRVPTLSPGSTFATNVPLAIPAALPGEYFATELEVDVAEELSQTAASAAVANDVRSGALLSRHQLDAIHITRDVLGDSAWAYGPVYGEWSAGRHEVAGSWSASLDDIAGAFELPVGADVSGFGAAGLVAAAQLADVTGQDAAIRVDGFWNAISSSGSRLGAFDEALVDSLRDAFEVPLEAYPDADGFELAQRGALIAALGREGDAGAWIDLAQSEGRAPSAPPIDEPEYDTDLARLNEVDAAQLYAGEKLSTAGVAQTAAPAGSLSFVQVSQLGTQMVMSSGKTDALASESVWQDLGASAAGNGGATPIANAATWGARSFYDIPDDAPTPGTAQGVHAQAAEFQAAGLDLTNTQTWVNPAGTWAEAHGAPAGLFGPGDSLASALTAMSKIQFAGKDDRDGNAPEGIWEQAADPNNTMQDLIDLWGFGTEDVGGGGTGTGGGTGNGKGPGSGGPVTPESGVTPDTGGGQGGDTPGASGGPSGGNDAGLPGGDLSTGGVEGTNDASGTSGGSGSGTGSGSGSGSGSGGGGGGGGGETPTGGETETPSETPAPTQPDDTGGPTTGEQSSQNQNENDVPPAGTTVTFETNADGSVTVTEQQHDGEGGGSQASGTFSDPDGDGVFTTTTADGEEIALNPDGGPLPEDGTHTVASSDGETNVIPDPDADNDSNDDSNDEDANDDDSDDDSDDDGGDDEGGEDDGGDGSDDGTDEGSDDGEASTSPCAVDMPCDDVSVDHGLIEFVQGLPGATTKSGEQQDELDRFILTVDTGEDGEGRLPPPRGDVDPTEEPPEGDGSADPTRGPGMNPIILPASSNGADVPAGAPATGGPGAPMGDNQPWACPRQAVVSSAGEVYFICPIRNDPQTGLPIAWVTKAPEQSDTTSHGATEARTTDLDKIE